MVSIDFMRGVETIDEDKSNDVHSLSVMRIALVFFFIGLLICQEVLCRYGNVNKKAAEAVITPELKNNKIVHETNHFTGLFLGHSHPYKR